MYRGRHTGQVRPERTICARMYRGGRGRGGIHHVTRYFVPIGKQDRVHPWSGCRVALHLRSSASCSLLTITTPPSLLVPFSKYPFAPLKELHRLLQIKKMDWIIREKISRLKKNNHIFDRRSSQGLRLRNYLLQTLGVPSSRKYHFVSHLEVLWDKGPSPHPYSVIMEVAGRRAHGKR